MQKFGATLGIRAVVSALLICFLMFPALVAAESEADTTGNPARATVAASLDAARQSAGVKGAHKTERTASERLQREFGVDAAFLESTSLLTDMRAEGLAKRADAQKTKLSSERDLESIERLGRSFERQIGNPDMPLVGRQVVLQVLVATHLEVARLKALRSASTASLTETQLFVDALDAQLAMLSLKTGKDSEGQRRVERAELSEKEALQTLEDAREREIREQNQQIRSLLVRERELAEELVIAAREDTEELRRRVEEHRVKTEEFAEQRVLLSERVSNLPDIVSNELARDGVDPLFDELLVLRRNARDARRAARREFETSRRELADVRAGFDDVQSELEQLKTRSAVLGNTELARRQVALAELRGKRARASLDQMVNRVDANEIALQLQVERAQFFHELVEQVLPKLSEKRRSRFYSPLYDDNWLAALNGLRAAADLAVAHGRERIEQAVVLPERIFSITFWSWTLGLGFRLLMFPISLYLGREYGPRLVRRLMDYLLKKRFFRQRASATIKFAEISRAVMLPLLMYFSLGVVIDYVTLLLPEAWVARAVIDVMIFYVVTMRVLKVMVLPRGFRERSVSNPSPDLSSLASANHIVDGVDVVKLEISRAQKLVLSVRFVIIFGLLARYVPAAMVVLMGHSVIWWTINQIFMYGFLAVFYLVLSSWKDDIARIFDRLAHDRLPRAVALVNNHKDRPYGVLLIAVASVYVAVFEVARIGKEWFVDTSWSRQASNFMFRKKIELQRREREEDGVEFELSSLPAAYLEHFQDFPLTDESYRLERPEIERSVNAAFERWKNRGKRGSVMLKGEAGIGKTTELFRLAEHLRQEPEREVVALRLCEKFHDTSDVFSFFASLFSLETVPTTRAELVQAIQAAPSRVVLIDDCHHFYLRKIGGFDAVDLFFDVVNRCDSKHFWVLSMNNFAWSYLNRVRARQHLFGAVLDIGGWNEADIQELIRRRDMLAGMPLSFSELMVAHENDDQYYEIVKTSNGYFRLLHEFSHGNPRVALLYWLRSLRHDAERGHLQVSLFQRPSPTVLTGVSNDHLFALAAIVQHGSLAASEVAEVTHIAQDTGEMLVDYLCDSEIVTIEKQTGRVRLTGLYFRSVLRQLSDANYLYE